MKTKVALALGVLYLGWGAMYFAIAAVVRAIPPLLGAGLEYLGGGIFIVLWSLGRRQHSFAGAYPGEDLGSARAWLGSLIVGGVMLAGGMAGFFWGEQYVASGLAALLGATISLWMSLLGASFLHEKLSWRSVLGIAIGVAAVGLLVTGTSLGSRALWGMLAVLGSSLSWSVGSLLLRQLGHLWSDAVVGTGMQMLAAALLLIAGGAAAGELSAGRWRAASWSTVVAELAVAGLSAFGVLAFRRLVEATSMALASSFSFVNPVVAVLLGVLAGSEVLNPRVLMAVALVVFAVVLLTPRRTGRQERLSWSDAEAGILEARIREDRDGE